MANKHLYWDDSNQTWKEREATDTSSGSSDSGKHVALNSDGDVDSTMMPPGVAAEILTITTSEDLSAGNLVNIYDDAGTPTARLADRSNGRRADGFVKASSVSGEDADVYLPTAQNTDMTGLTVAADLYLSTAGGVEETATTNSGDILQRVGKAGSATSFLFDPSDPVERA